MPIYEFVCQDCGYEFEKIQSFSDSSTPACPNCQGVRVQRRLSAPAIHFKGSGWYITDSKNSGKTSASGPAGGNGEAGKEGGKSEAGKVSDAGSATSDGGKSDGVKSEGSKGSASKADAGSASAAKAATD